MARVVTERLDVLLVQRGQASTREKAQRIIMAGEVFVAGQRVSKPGIRVPADATVEVRAGLPFVSRGGVKLAHALERFALSVAGRVAVDIGASTGGFSDVLLQGGAARVYAIDVGYGQLDWKIRSDPRVVVMDRTNIRNLQALPEPADFICVDVSFISLMLVLPVARRLLRPDGDLVVLVKPQFEVGKGQVGKGGVVREPALWQGVLTSTLEYCAKNGWVVLAVCASPLKGAAGNVEFLMHLRVEQAPGRLPVNLAALVDSAVADAAALS